MTLWSLLERVDAISVCIRKVLLVVESGASYGRFVLKDKEALVGSCQYQATV